MWPFDIFAKRRAREAQRNREEQDRRMQAIKDSIAQAAKRRQQERETLMNAQAYRSMAAIRKPTPHVSAAPSAPARAASSTSSVYDDTLSPLNPLSPAYAGNSHLSLVQSDESHHSCSPSSYDSGSSHSHSSHDHGCSSSSYDSGSSSSSSDW